MSMILALSDTHLNGPLEDNTFVFTWNLIPGSVNETKKFKDFLIKKFSTNWIEAAEIKKTANNMVINIDTTDKSLSLTLNEEKTEVEINLEDASGQTRKLKAIRQNNVINIYNMNYYPPQLRSLVKTANLVLHAGDFECQDAYDDLVYLCAVSKCELWAIQGNHPTIIYKDGAELSTQKAENWFGINIGLIHYEVNSHDLSLVLPQTAQKAKDIEMENTGDMGADFLVFGHIHEPIIKWHKDDKDESGKMRLLVCPGPGSSNAVDSTHRCPPCPTVALLECHNGSISSAEIIAIRWT